MVYFRVALIFAGLLAAPAAGAGAAADPPHVWPAAGDGLINTNTRGLALAGYDPVAYFEVGGGQAVKGKKDFTAEHRGGTYRFVSAAHRDLFTRDPERFLPAFGGWCAYAMADGKRVEVDPKRFEVHDGRLFLFYRDWFTDTLKPWQKQRGTLLPRADAAWQKIVEEDDADE